MTAQVPAEAVGDEGFNEVACWCCGQWRVESGVVRLGEHPEVAVCFGCAHFLHAARPSPAARARDFLRAARELVIRRGWHSLPVIGAMLRRLGSRLP